MKKPSKYIFIVLSNNEGYTDPADALDILRYLKWKKMKEPDGKPRESNVYLSLGGLVKDVLDNTVFLDDDYGRPLQ